MNPKNKEPRIRRTVSAEELAKKRMAGPSTKGYDPLLEPGTQRSMQGYVSKWDGFEDLELKLTSEEKEALKKAYRDVVSSRPKSIYDVIWGGPQGGFLPTFDSSDRESVKKILQKDSRIKENDYSQIMATAANRKSEIGKDGKTLGSVVREEVEKYLARREAVEKYNEEIKKYLAEIQQTELSVGTGASRMDPEAAIACLKEYIDVKPRLDIEVNRFLVITGKVPEEFLEYEKQEILPLLAHIPKGRMDDKIAPGVSVRSIVSHIADVAYSDELRKAATDLLSK